jgi:leucyl aminopeptidase (aminopeptidase T)
MTEQQAKRLEAACRRFLHDILLMEVGDSLLVYIDGGSDASLAESIVATARAMGMVADSMPLQRYSDLSAQTAALRAAIQRADYRVLCELSETYLYPSGIWAEAVRAGRRVYSAGPIDAECFQRCITSIDYSALAAMGDAIKQLVSRARNVRVTSYAGTQLTCRMQPHGTFEKLLNLPAEGSLPDRLLFRMGMAQRPFVWSPTGTLRRQGGSTFMGGQLSFRPVPRSLNGTAIIDGYQWPPNELGRLRKPLALRIERGEVTNIGGDTGAATLLESWLENRDRRVEHLCIGYNPGAGIAGSLTEAERAYGYINLGFGTYPFHTDGVMISPTLRLDDQLILDKHSFCHATLTPIEQDLRGAR